MMKKISEVCKMFDLDRNYLRRLDKKGTGILPPTTHDKSGLNTGLYDDVAIERLWMIILFHRELGYELDKVGRILDDPLFDRNECLSKQIEELHKKVEHLNKVISVAEAMKVSGLGPQEILDTENMTAREFVDTLAGEISNVNPDISVKVKSALKDKMFTEAFASIAKANMEGVSISSPDISKEVEKMLNAFEQYFGKSGRKALKRVAEMLRADGVFATAYDNILGTGSSTYVGNAIFFNLERS